MWRVVHMYEYCRNDCKFSFLIKMSMTKIKSLFDKNRKLFSTRKYQIMCWCVSVDCIRAVQGYAFIHTYTYACTYIFLEIPQIVVEIETQMFAHFVNHISQVVYFVLQFVDSIQIPYLKNQNENTK
jgi:hypothetical protein